MMAEGSEIVNELRVNIERVLEGTSVASSSSP